MKRKLLIGVICLFSIIFILLTYYCYIQYQQNKDIIVSTVELVDSTTIYKMDELLGRLSFLSDEDLRKIRRLDMSFYGDHPRGTKGYDAFPPIVSQLTNLEYLDLSWNEISDLTPIQHLRHLKTIIMSNNHVTNFEGFKNFTDLENLNINGNQLSDLKGIEVLQNLQSLNLLWNQNLSDLKGIEKLIKLEDLTIGKNNFELFPMEILQLKNLKRLSMTDLYFKSFPDSLYDLPIEILEMKDMHDFDYSANLPKFHKLKKLRELYLLWDNISTLSIDFAKCENLEIFSYRYYKKENIADLKYYTEKQKPPTKYYPHFDITDVLTRIAKTPKLKKLFLELNNIQYLPKNLVLSDSLEVLDLYNNHIKTLPVKITKYTNLREVYLKSNPIDTVAIKKIEKEMVNTKFYYDK